MAIYASVPKNLGGMSNPIGFFMKNCQQRSRGEDCFLDSVETAEEQDARQRLEKRKADRERARQEEEREQQEEHGHALEKWLNDLGGWEAAFDAFPAVGPVKRGSEVHKALVRSRFVNGQGTSEV
jgi:hypothetical protein